MANKRKDGLAKNIGESDPKNLGYKGGRQHN